MNLSRPVIALAAILFISASLSAVVSDFPYLESFETGFGVWVQDPTNQLDWTRISGPTPSSGTGPLGAYDGSWYIYTEASGFNPSNRGIVMAEFDFSTLSNPGMTFYYHMYGNSMGELYVDAFDGIFYAIPWSMAGQQQTSETDPWRKAEVDLSLFAGSSNVTIRFRGITGSSFTSDMCVDKVKVFDDIPRIELDPTEQSGEALPGGNVNYDILLENKTGGDTTFTISYVNDPWNTLGPVTTGNITNNGSIVLTVQVQVPAGVIAGEQSTSTVQVVSTDQAFTGTAYIVTVSTWTYYPLPCETWDTFPNGWTNYIMGQPAVSWQQIGFGNPAPGLYHPRYPAAMTNWFVSPPIDISNPFGEKLSLTFDQIIFNTLDYDYAGVLISGGSRDPASGDYIELLDLYDDSGNWITRDIDITYFQGANPGYIAFLYIGSNAQEIVIDNVCVRGDKFDIDNSFLVSPTSAVGMCSQALPPFKGTLYIDGQTGPDGPAANISAEVGFGTPGTMPGDNFNWRWVTAAYTGPVGIFDAFEATPALDAAGTFDTAYRFRIGAAGWTYADLDGSSNGYDSAKAGYLSVSQPDPPGNLVYNQALEGDSYVFPSTVFSNDSPSLSYLAADDFVLPVDADIHVLQWRGQYQVGSRWEDMPGFIVRIYDNQGSNALNAYDHPGTILTEDFYPGHACAMLVENNAYYHYYLPLSSPFHVNRGETYWFSIQQLSTVNESAWYIKTTPATITGSAGLYTNSGTNWFSLGGDLGIEMYGSYTNNGILSGLVTSDYNGQPLYNATIAVVGSTNLSVATSRDGTYMMPVPLGTYDIYATARNYNTAIVSGVSFTTSGQTREENFALVGSLLTYDPAGIEEVLMPGEIVTNSVTVTNSGPRAISFTAGLANLPGSPFLPLAPAPVPTPVSQIHLPRSDGTYPRGTAEPSIVRAPLDDSVKRLVDTPLSSTLLASGAPAFATEVPNYTLITFNTANPGSNGVAGTVDSRFIWASDFLPFDLSRLFAIFDNNEFIVIDPTDGSYTTLGSSIPTSGLSWTGLAGDPDGTLYASATSVSRSELYTIDKIDGTATLIGTISNSPGCIAIAINAEGELYGFDIINDSLIAIDKTTGAGTIVGSLGFDANFGQGMDFDYESGICYLAAFNNGTFRPELRIADITTGNTTNVGAFAVNQIGSMAVATLNAPDWATASPNQGTIAAGGSTSFDLVFDSTAVPTTGTYRAELIFTGTFVNKPPKMPLTMHVATGPMISAPSVIDFGGMYVNDSVTGQLPVRNTGFGIITGHIENVAAPFGVQGTTNYILQSLVSTRLLPYFAPAGPGTFSNIVTLTGGGGTTVLFTGYTLPTIETIPTSLEFPETEIGDYVERNIVCKNIGGGVLEGSVSGPAEPYTLTGNPDYALSSLQSTFYTIRFTPTDVGTFNDTLVFTGGGGAQVPITGDGIPEPVVTWLLLLLLSAVKRKLNHRR